MGLIHPMKIAKEVCEALGIEPGVLDITIKLSRGPPVITVTHLLTDEKAAKLVEVLKNYTLLETKSG